MPVSLQESLQDPSLRRWIGAAVARLVWIGDPREDLRIGSAIRFAIDAAFRAAGITIPFPQRDLHVRTGRTLPGSA